MPVENSIAPKSALRHRPIGDSTPPQPARKNRLNLSDVPTATLRASHLHATDTNGIIHHLGRFPTGHPQFSPPFCLKSGG